MGYGKAMPKLPGWRNDNRYDFGTFYPGVPGNSQTLLRWVFVRRVRLPANFQGSQCSCGSAATGSTTLTVKQISGGVTTTIGTIVVGAGGSTGAFSTTNPQDVWLAAGDVVTVTGPATADATLGDIAIAFAGTAGAT